MKTLFEQPTDLELYEALCRRDAEYEGLFVVGVKTTGVFCRPTCPARKPKLTNVNFYRNATAALLAGFRPCKRCLPMECLGKTPIWMQDLLSRVENDPTRRWKDQDLRELGCEPARVRRWFKQHHGMTFHAYLRARRLGNAIGQIQVGATNTTRAAFQNGYESASGFREAFQNWFGASPNDSQRNGPAVIFNRILTPLGPMVVAAVNERICLLEFVDRKMLETQCQRIKKFFGNHVVPGSAQVFEQLESELGEYFHGKRRQFSTPIAIEGTPFQKRVWNSLLQIPFGNTCSYEDIARSIDRPGASRAVGRANGDNRIAILVPCHRVVRSDGTLSGYGGGVWRKRILIELESGQSVPAAVGAETNIKY